MLTRSLTLLLFLFAMTSFGQQPKVEEVRVITNDRLSLLSYAVRNTAIKNLLTTVELRDRLGLIPPTEAILLTKGVAGPQDQVWYTDYASTAPRSITVSRSEHDLLTEYVEGGVSRIMAMEVKRQTVMEFVLVDKMGEKVKVPVYKTIDISPSDEAVKSAVADIQKVRNEEVRNALEVLAGAKFNELYPTNSKLKSPAEAKNLAAKYRQTVYTQAVTTVAAIPATQLPPLNEPFLFGRENSDILSLARAIDGAEPASTFETASGKYAVVWDKSTLVVVRQPKSNIAVDTKLRLNDTWLKAIDPKNKDVIINPHLHKLSPDLLRPGLLPLPPGIPPG